MSLIGGKYQEFIHEYVILGCKSMLEESIIQVWVCLILSCYVMFVGVKNRVISLTIILSMVATILLKTQITKVTANSSNREELFANEASMIYNYFIGICKFINNHPYLLIVLFLILSHLIIKALDISLTVYLCYLLTQVYDSLKSVYSNSYSFGSIYLIMILIVLISYKIASYVKPLLVSAFYAIIGSTFFLVGVDVLLKTKFDYANAYGEMLRMTDASHYIPGLLAQVILVIVSMLVQVRKVYFK